MQEQFEAEISEKRAHNQNIAVYQVQQIKTTSLQNQTKQKKENQQNHSKYCLPKN